MATKRRKTSSEIRELVLILLGAWIVLIPIASCRRQNRLQARIERLEQQAKLPIKVKTR